MPREPKPIPGMKLADWPVKAACRDMDTSVFFDARQQAVALEACRYCPVAADCLALADAAETDGYAYGVFGGLTARQRKAHRSKTHPA